MKKNRVRKPKPHPAENSNAKYKSNQIHVIR